MAIGDLYKATLSFGQGITQWRSTFAYRQIAGVDDFNTHNAACFQLQAAINSELLAILSDQTSFFLIEWHTINGPNHVPGSWRPAGVNTGTVIDQPAPLNLAIVMRLYTDAPRGQANGRLFISGISELQMFDGQLDAAALANVNTLGATLDDNLAGGLLGAVVYEPVVVSRWEFGLERPIPIGNKILSVAGQSIIYNQRTRMRKSKSVSYTLGG